METSNGAIGAPANFKLRHSQIWWTLPLLTPLKKTTNIKQTQVKLGPTPCTQVNIPRARSDLLMLAPSVKRMPLQPLAEARSEPARSIIDSFMIFTLRLSLLVIRMYTWKTECERDDSALASVGCWVLFLFPCAIRANRLSAFAIQWIERPGMRTSDVLTSIRESGLDGRIRSRTFSL